MYNMYNKRLTALAAHLRTVAPENFQLGDWSCGTAACAVGHACTMPEFQAKGLRIEPYEGLRTGHGVPWFGRVGGWSAVRAFFDLDFSECYDLFHQGHYRGQPQGPDDVADRIEAFVRGAA